MIPFPAWRAHAARWALAAPFDPEAELERCREMGIRVLGLDHPGYPQLLRSIPDPPEVLYVSGTLPPDGNAVAVVGSRKPTLYGRRMARLLAGGCAAGGLAVASGLARGVDAEAHASALGVGGRTWAVLGSGLARLYPPEHEALAGRILAGGGALLSELPLDGLPAARHFPMRNRIVSGLAWGTVVVEGDMRSGSLITARRALEQGREVFAVPGPADSPLSAGPLELLRQGAALACRPEDILGGLPGGERLPEGTKREAASADGGRFPAGSREARVLELLGGASAGLEELLEATGWTPAHLRAILSELENRGAVRALPGQAYARSQEP